jgi:polyisoprenoid-binding protein YceI
MRSLLLIALVLNANSISWSQRYEPSDSKSSIAFKIKNFGATVDGTFKNLKGAIRFDPNELSSSHFNVSVTSSTIDTGIELRNKHLKKEDYFDVEKFGEINFVSIKIESTSQVDRFMVTGKLTIKKTTKEIKFDFTAKKLEMDYQFKSEFQINRRDYGVGGSSFSMADEVKVILSINCVSVGM